MFNTLKNLLRPAEQKASCTSRLIAIESGARAGYVFPAMTDYNDLLHGDDAKYF